MSNIDVLPQYEDHDHEFSPEFNLEEHFEKMYKRMDCDEFEDYLDSY